MAADPVPLRRDQRADHAASLLLLALLSTIRTRLPEALADADPERLHELRVAVRRTRSVQRQLKAVFPPEPLARFREELRWVQQVTGPTRDLDVWLMDLDGMAAGLREPARSDLRPLRLVLLEHRRAEQARMAEALRSPRMSALLEDWSAFLQELPGAPEAARPAAARPVAEVAGHRIRRVYRHMVEAGCAVGDDTPAEALHALRKTGKELRYLLELFGPLWPDEATKPLVKRLKRLQDVLGLHQDREVQVAMLRSLAGELGAGPDGTRAVLAVGALVALLEDQAEAARADFAERFSKFAARDERRLVKKTFR